MSPKTTTAGTCAQSRTLIHRWRPAHTGRGSSPPRGSRAITFTEMPSYLGLPSIHDPSRHWDPLFENDKDGMMQRIMDEVCDGELQNFKSNGPAYTRKHFFGKYPETAKLVENLSDEEINKLNRGGHDP